MPDDIGRLSEVVARDPNGLAWVALAEAQRRARQLVAAERTALRGLERHPHHAEGHEVLARISADSGNLSRARDEWEMARSLAPGNVGAWLGLSWLASRAGDLETARRSWERAMQLDPADPRVIAAGRRFPAAAAAPAAASRGMPDDSPGNGWSTGGGDAAGGADPAQGTDAAARRVDLGRGAATNLGSSPDRMEAASRSDASAPAAPATRRAATTPLVASPRSTGSLTPLAVAGEVDTFASLRAAGARVAMLVDRDGLVLAGGTASAFETESPDAATPTSAGRRRARNEVVAAELSGLSAEVTHAVRQLQLGEWERVLVECDGATLAMAPTHDDSVALVLTPAGGAAGWPRLLLDKAQQRANEWLEAL